MIANTDANPFLMGTLGEPIRITYSYWDGSGHRNEVVVSAIIISSILPNSATSDLMAG